MRALLAVFALLLFACGEPDPVAVPDLSGMPLADARTAANDIDVELEEVDGSGQGRVVFSPGNWTVETQDPPAGEDVTPGSTVTVEVANIRDTEPEPEPEPETEEPEPDPTPNTEEPESETRETSLDIAVGNNALGVSFTAAADYSGCSADLNAGLIRSGYTTNVGTLVAGEERIVPYGDFTDSGERFDFSTTRPEMITVECVEGYDTWSW